MPSLAPCPYLCLGEDSLARIPFSVRNGFSLSGQSSSVMLYQCVGHATVRTSYGLNFLFPIVWRFSCCLVFNHVPWTALSTRPFILKCSSDNKNYRSTAKILAKYSVRHPTESLKCFGTSLALLICLQSSVLGKCSVELRVISVVNIWNYARVANTTVSYPNHCNITTERLASCSSVTKQGSSSCPAEQWSTSCGRKQPLSGPDITGVSVVRQKKNVWDWDDSWQCNWGEIVGWGNEVKNEKWQVRMDKERCCPHFWGAKKCGFCFCFCHTWHTSVSRHRTSRNAFLPRLVQVLSFCVPHISENNCFPGNQQRIPSHVLEC